MRSNEISFEESIRSCFTLVAHEKFVNLTIQQWKSLICKYGNYYGCIHNDSLLFDLIL